MAGASPRTAWLKDCVVLDNKGFILTGRDLDSSAEFVQTSVWPPGRAPQLLETSLPGVFAVGDVRSGNVKRVASAVGEGAIAIHLVTVRSRNYNASKRKNRKINASIWRKS
jgi:thioredoxin reductase (NADPH)